MFSILALGGTAATISTVVEWYDGVRGEVNCYQSSEIEDEKKMHFQNAVDIVAARYEKYIFFTGLKFAGHMTIAGALGNQIVKTLGYIVGQLKMMWECINIDKIFSFLENIEKKIKAFCDSIKFKIKTTSAGGTVIKYSKRLFGVFNAVGFFVINTITTEVTIYWVEILGIWKAIEEKIGKEFCYHH